MKIKAPSWRLTLISTITLSAFAPSALAQILSNGGFEIPAVASGSVTYTAGQSFAGWTVDVGSVSLQSECPPLSGLQSAYLPWTVGTNTIRQDLDTTVGTQYVLSYTRACGNGCGCDAIAHRVFVSWGAELVTDDRAWEWARNSYVFTADGVSTRLSFSGSEISLDDIRVFQLPTVAIRRLAEGKIQVMAGITTCRNYFLEASIDLKNWTILVSFGPDPMPCGPDVPYELVWDDLDSANSPQRFYRVRRE